MAKVTKHNVGDVSITFPADEFSTLQSLLYDLQDKNILLQLLNENKVTLTEAQISRISTMWKNLSS